MIPPLGFQEDTIASRRRQDLRPRPGGDHRLVAGDLSIPRRHSLQIEVHRGLYLDEITRERSSGFDALQNALTSVAQEIAAYVKNQVMTTSKDPAP